MSEQTIKELTDKATRLIADAKAEIIEARAAGDENPEKRESVERKLAEAKELKDQVTEMRTKAAVEEERGRAADLAASLEKEQKERGEDSFEVREHEQIRALATRTSWDDKDGKGIDLASAAYVSELRSQGASDKEIRTLLVGTDNKGGYTVPTTLEATLYKSLTFRRGTEAAGAAVLNTPTGELRNITRRTAVTGITGVDPTGENTNPPVVEATYGRLSTSAYKYGGIALITEELQQDSNVDMVSEAAQEIGEYFSGVTETLFTNEGSGTDEPESITNGIPAGQTVTITRTSKQEPNFKDMTNIVKALDRSYVEDRNSVGWLMTNDTYVNILALTDSNNRPLHTIPTTQDPFERFLGHPIYFTEYLEDWGANRNLIVFGNFNRGFLIRKSGNFQLRMSNEIDFVKGGLQLRGVGRVDSAVIDSEALVLGKTGA